MVDLRHLRVGDEAGCDLARVLALTVHAQGQRLQAAMCEPGLERTEHATDELAELFYCCCVRRTGDHRAGREVPMPRQVLGRAVDDYVRAELQGPLEIWCAEGVVHDQGGPRGAGSSEICGMSATRKSGLEMDSTTTARGLSSATFFSTAPRSYASTKRVSTPLAPKTWTSRVAVDP